MDEELYLPDDEMAGTGEMLMADGPEEDMLKNIEGKMDVDHMLLGSRAQKAFVKNEEIETIKARNLRDLCIIPKEGEQWRIATCHPFSAYTVIKYLLEDMPVIEELYLSVFRINMPTASALTHLIMAGKIKKCVILMCTIFYNNASAANFAEHLKAFCESREECTCIFTNVHSKIALIKGGGGYYVFEGSGNMSSNGKYEQYLLENRKMMYDFHKSWMDEAVAIYNEKGISASS